MAEDLLNALPASLTDVFQSYSSALTSLLHPSDGGIGSFLLQLHAFWYSAPTLLLLVGHCVMCTTLAPEAKKHFLLHYWLTFLAGFAGGPMSALLIMNPEKAPISLMGSNKAGVTWTLCWWLMTYSPLAPVLHAIYNLKPVKAACRTCVQYLRATLIVSRVVLVAQLYPGVLLAPILAATVSACAGKTTYDALRHIYGFSAGPAEFTVPTYSFRSAFLGSSMLFLSSVNPWTRFLNPEQGAACLITLFVGTALLSELTGRTMDWSAALLKVVLRVCHIPWPEGIPQPLPAQPTKPATTPALKPASAAAATTTSGKPALSALPNKQQQNGNTSSNGSIFSVSATGPNDLHALLERNDVDNEDNDYRTAVAAAMAVGKVVDADVIRAALQKSTKQKKSAKAPNDGWQVVESRRKPEVKKTK